MTVKHLFALLLLTCHLAHAQERLSISGKVTNATAQPVSNAFIHLLNTNFTAFTDEQGQFTLTSLEPGEYEVVVSAMGHATLNKRITVARDAAPLNFSLAASFAQLDAVIVTAQKQEENVQAVPSAISALRRKDVEAYRLWASKDLTAIVPNLYAGNPGDGRNVISIRGVTSSSYDPAVTTYIDGVSQFSLDTYIPQLFDVERIEVLRGPQGTLYGRNAMGGIINIITRQPSAKTEGFAEMSLGNYGLRRFTTGLRLPVIKNRLHAGAAVLYEELDGYYRNVFNNSKFDRQYRLGANYYLKYSGGTKWNAVLNIKHLANRNRGAFTLAGNKDEAFANPFMVNQNAIGRLVDNTFNGSLSLNHLGKRVVVSAQTAYQSNYRYYETPVDADFSPIDGVDIINNYGREWNNVKVLTQELKFSSAAPLKWVAGVFLFHQKIPNRQATHFGEDAAFVGAPDKNFAIVNTTKATNTGSSLFAQGTYAITQQLEVIAGLRYDYQRTRQSVLSEYQPDASPVPVFEIRPDTSARASYSALSPKLGLQFHQHQNTSLYLLYSRGYRTGGLTQLSADPSQPPLFAYKPEYSNNFELGSKNVLFSNRLRANIALFYTTITNAQVATLVLPDAITITKNTGSLTSKGVEAELAATLLKGLEAAYNLGYTQAKYTALKVAQNGGVTDLAGRRQVFTPELTSMLALQYGIDVSRAVKLVARGEWLYVGETYFDLANTIRQAPYHLLNARAGIALKHVELMFWARNLSDTKYIGYAYEFGAVHLADPKTYGLTLRAMF